MKTQIISNPEIKKESEKAMLIEFSWQHLENLSLHRYSSWFPKSQVNVDGDKVSAAEWILDKIADEIRAKYGMCRNLGGNGITYNF